MPVERDGPIHLLCAADASYGPWLGVMLASVLAFDHGGPVVVHLLSDGIRATDLRRLNKLCGSECLRVYDVRRFLAGETTGFHTSLHITRTAYARIFLGRLIDPSVSRVIWLDCDIACRGSLRDLWQTDLSDALIAAVPDFLGGSADRARAMNEKLGLAPGQPYFNSGVLLIDVEKWRARDIGATLVAHIKEMGARLGGHDQDAINMVLGHEIKPLPARWNFQAGREAQPDGSEILIHFIGGRKPWDLDHPSPLAKYFLDAKARSPWRWTPRLPYKIRRLRYSGRKRLAWLRTRLNNGLSQRSGG